MPTHYLEELPLELQRNLALLRDVDASSHALMMAIESDINQFIGGVDALNSEEALQALRQVSSKFSEVLKHSEDKVALATQAYSLADQSIQRLDQDLLKFETEELVNLKPIKVSHPKQTLRESDTTPKAAHEASSLIKRKTQKDPESRESRTKIKHMAPVDEDFYDGFQEMPVDPHEPLYCFCNQISYGEMVACDDETCDREWFHYQCVKLKAPPKGKWYCSDCIDKQKPNGRNKVSDF